MESWRNNAVKIMICTTAFGLGIDQPDVEVVMRVGCPPTIETMIQEFGRASKRPAKEKRDVKEKDQQKVSKIESVTTCFMIPLSVTGILFYHENDLQHASYWAKSNMDVLKLFFDSWK